MNIESQNPKKFALLGMKILGVLLAGLILLECFFTTEAGYNYVYQNTLSGKMEVYKEPGVHLKVPFFNKIESYKQVITISFGQHDDTSSFTNAASEPITVRYADTYTGHIPVAFRLKLPLNTDEMIKIHRDFRSFANLADALMIRTTKDVVVNTATQYTGEEFFQGGLNQFKGSLEDQMQNGIYKTERRQVEIEDIGITPISIDQTDSNQLQKRTTLVWKTVPMLDDAGKMIRLNNPMHQYGIEVTQVTIGDTKPDETLDKMLVDKKKLVAQRINAIQSQETAKAQAQAEQLQKEIERTKARQDALREKELAVIEQQKELEVAMKIAERERVEQEKQATNARIQKQKELENAIAEKNIQEANAKASEFSSKAILTEGRARAEVALAMSQAKLAAKDILIAEFQKDVAIALYQNMKDFAITMPQNVVGANNGNLPNNLDILTGFSALQLMDKTTKQSVVKNQ